MQQIDLKAEFEKRQPWFTKIIVDGQEWGGKYDAGPDPRPDMFFECFPEASVIADLGSLEGVQAFRLAQRPTVKRVVGIEGRAENIDKASFLQKLFHVTNVDFIQADLERVDLAALGPFDAAFCCGVLYHLPAPWKLIEELARATPNVFIWTHYAGEAQADVVVEGYRGRWYQEHGLADPLSGLSARSLWLTQPELIRMIREHGFRYVEVVTDWPVTDQGPCVALAVSKHPLAMSKHPVAGAQAAAATPVWRLPGRALQVLRERGPRALAFEVKQYVRWLIGRSRTSRSGQPPHPEG